MSAETKVDVLERILNCGESMRDVHDAVVEQMERVELLQEQRDALESAVRKIKDIASERAIDYMAARYRVRVASEDVLARVGGAP